MMDYSQEKKNIILVLKAYFDSIIEKETFGLALRGIRIQYSWC